MNPETYVENSTRITVSMFGRILDDVNKIRIALGIGEGKLPELPKGVPGNAEQCVLANALSNGWEARVASSISLTHPEEFEKPFSWEKALDALKKLGFDAKLFGRGFSTTGCACSNCIGTDPTIEIQLTQEMDWLIGDFDNNLLPSLIQNESCSN